MMDRRQSEHKDGVRVEKQARKWRKNGEGALLTCAPPNTPTSCWLVLHSSVRELLWGVDFHGRDSKKNTVQFVDARVTSWSPHSAMLRFLVLMTQSF